MAILLGIIPFSFDIKCNYIIKTDDTRIIQNNNSLNINYSYPIILSSIMYIDNMEVKYERKLNKPTGKCTFNSIRKITEILNDYQDRIIKGDTTVILPLVLYYNSQHQWFHFQEKNAVFPNNQRINGYINCINNNSGDKLMMNWFYKETLKKLQNKTGSTLFDKVIMTIEQCILFFIKDITDVKISYNFDNNDIEIQYKECNQNNTYLLSQWNDNYKYIIYIIIDILYRIAQLNPQLMNDVLNTPGIVIIDDIDNIFHFNLQKELLLKTSTAWLYSTRFFSR